MVLKGQAQDNTITFQAELKPISAMQPTVGLLAATQQISLTAMCFAKGSGSQAGLRTSAPHSRSFTLTLLHAVEMLDQVIRGC